MEKRGYSRDAVMKEITEREPDYERYIAPQKEFADAVIGIDYSEFGQDLGLERNVYRITLSQNRMNHAMEDIDLSLDLYSILSLSQRNFSLKFLTSDHNNHRIGQLVMDGELREDVGEKLERSIENQTRVHPISLFRHTGLRTRRGSCPADSLLADYSPPHFHGDLPVMALHGIPCRGNGCTTRRMQCDAERNKRPRMKGTSPSPKKSSSRPSVFCLLGGPASRTFGQDRRRSPGSSCRPGVYLHRTGILHVS